MRFACSNLHRFIFFVVVVVFVRVRGLELLNFGCFRKKKKVKIKSDDEILKFHALVQQNYIDVGKIFPEVPEFYNR